ncbi:MAG: hypothetical protein M0P55_05345 [Clostridiales bacterium]|nr:hypothetical protein [Clostridiales bacterium]
MLQIDDFRVTPISMITQEGLQRVDLHTRSSAAAQVRLTVCRGAAILHTQDDVHIVSGQGYTSVFLPPPDSAFDAAWQLTDDAGRVIAAVTVNWPVPRRWTLYTLVASHTDIGLHNAQYIQRHNSERFIDQAMALCDRTGDRAEQDRYHYMIEGTWFWGNYPADRGRDAARRVVEEYVKPGRIGLCGGIAGNHTQVFGLEELCRSTYGRRALQDTWGVTTKTMAMIDNNGMSWSLVQPYAEAGFEQIIFAPNQWNPHPSTVWTRDSTVPGFVWNPDAGGGGARVDVRYDSALPMVFYWQAPDDKSRLLVWCSAQYGWGGAPFGLSPRAKADPNTLRTMEERMARQLPRLEDRYPYDLWLLACYEDDQEPGLDLTDAIQNWNERYCWPQIRTVGNPDEPFDRLRQQYDGQIPVLSGEITGGWYQHPLSTPDLLARKFAADRLLPTAEKLACLAALVDPAFAYPKMQFDRAWQALLLNDEHSYGTSGYQGRRVYETWMQHRDWIEKAEEIAGQVSARALDVLAAQVDMPEESVLVFNPTAQPRCERITHEGKSCLVDDLPPFGYKTIALSSFTEHDPLPRLLTEPPVVENQYYRLAFSPAGALHSIYDKQLARELISPSAEFLANEFVYTQDNHKTYHTPNAATFELTESPTQTRVVVHTREAASRAAICQQVTLPHHEKRIDIDNRLSHVADMFNRDRYHRYAYYAFPFAVDNGRRFCQLNGSLAEYGKSLTGHGTDVYLPAHEWCCVENDTFGVALCQLDSQLVEFDHIHTDKTDYGNPGKGSAIFVYLANDWLQMHVPDGDQLNVRFRYAITSYIGTHETARIASVAERFAHPVLQTVCPAHPGPLSRGSGRFLTLEPDLRLVNLKLAEDGNGLIARFFGRTPRLTFSFEIAGGRDIARVTTDERDRDDDPKVDGFATYRVGQSSIRLRVAEPEALSAGDTPAAIGAFETGLITHPRAVCGEHQGHLYLLWGKNIEPDLSHYELYRGEYPGFAAGDDTFLARVEPEPYCVGRYEDTGLKTHTWYYYRVRAVNRQGKKGPLSAVFGGLTRAGEP